MLDKTTDSNGQASLTYTDTGPINAPSSDTVNAWADIVTENDALTAGEQSGSATNNFITEPATAGTVDLDVTNDAAAACAVPATVDPANDSQSYDPAATTTTHTVCALVKTAGGAPLAGKNVTFTLSGVGSFVKADGTALASPQTATTDAKAWRACSSPRPRSGTQTITAAIDGKSDAGVITYNAATPASARFIDLTPNTGTIQPGSEPGADRSGHRRLRQPGRRHHGRLHRERWRLRSATAPPRRAA